MKSKVLVFWFRRDLRLEDNTGLYHALNSGIPVLPIFIFDSSILEQLEDKKDRRVDYIQQATSLLNNQLKEAKSRLVTFYGNPLDIFSQLTEQYDIHSVYCNRDYEPQAIKRDAEVFLYLSTKNILLRTFKDQVIFDHKDILKNDGTPYTVYTPYAKKWKEKLQEEDYLPFSYEHSNFVKIKTVAVHSLEKIGFEKTDFTFEPPLLDKSIIATYDKYRDYPSLQKTTQLGTALRFGTISIRQCVEFANKHNQTWLSELIWREFFMQIMYHYPHVVEQSFKPKYDFIQWRNKEEEFTIWCQGKTGYPIVDAGMRQLNETGYMHNRVRMIVASFLCKHLLIDWRWGEAYFAKTLNDYDLSANNGNWQWAAGSGCDAAPYFRVFNPSIQTEKFDKDLAYIKKWIPEYETLEYPIPMVDHSFARDRALRVYKAAVKDNI